MLFFTYGLSTPPFWLVIGNQHPNESVDSAAQKIYAKVTRPFFSHPHTKEKKQSGNARLALTVLI